MKKPPIIIMFLCLGRFCFAEAPVRPLEVGDVIPQFTAVDIYGKEVNIEKLKGKVAIVSISYFDQSRMRSESNSPEVKKFIDFCNAYRNKGLELVRISTKRAVPFFVSKSFVENRARRICEKTNDDWTLIIDWDHSLKELLKMKDGPLAFIVDKNGIIRYKSNGFLIIDDKVAELIQKLL